VHYTVLPCPKQHVALPGQQVLVIYMLAQLHYLNVLAEIGFLMANALCVSHVALEHNRRTWSAVRSEDDFLAFSAVLHRSLSVELPPASVTASAETLERYMHDLLQSSIVLAAPELYSFLDAPPDVAEEPVLVGEVIADDDWQQGRRVRSGDASRERDPDESSGQLC
jgi:hypothetical protein